MQNNRSMCSSATCMYMHHMWCTKVDSVTPWQDTFNSGVDMMAQCTINVELCCRPSSLLMAYSAHIFAALASLWNVADAAAIIQHFKSQPAANDIEGCTASDIEGCSCNNSATDSSHTSVRQEMPALQ